MADVSRAAGRVAMVIGSSRGIGRATLLELARAGYAVVVNYRESHASAETLSSELERMGAEYLVFQADVSSWSALEAMFDRVFGGVGPRRSLG